MLRNCTCAHVGCYAIALAHMLDATQLHLRTCWMLRNCTCAQVRCYAIALAHMFDATQLHLRTCWMLRNCTCAHVRGYAIALAHMLDATQLHLRTCWMLRNCTCAHVRCYAIALAHMLDATQLHLRTCWMLRNCTCAHVGCYAIALAHMLDATQLHLRTVESAAEIRASGLLRCLKPKSRKAFYTDGAKAWNTVARALKMKCYQCSHQKKIFAVDMKRKPRGLSKRTGTQTIDRAWLSLKRFLPKEANKKKGKGVFADVRELLGERVKQWTWRAELLRVNPHLSKQQFLKHLAKVC